MTPDEQKAYAEPKDKRTMQEKHFDEVYAVFYAYYLDALRKDPPAYTKVKLMLTTRFFDDLALQKLVFPIFERFSTTPADKQAIALAAYLDALTLHNRTAGLKFVDVSMADVAKGKGNY